MTKEEVIETLSSIRQVNDLYARGETQEQYDWRMAQSAVAIERAISMLQNATIWTPCSERMPTVEDGDKEGAVNWYDEEDGYCIYNSWDAKDMGYDYSHWSRITPIETTKEPT